jgi:hypothetical protein
MSTTTTTRSTASVLVALCLCVAGVVMVMPPVINYAYSDHGHGPQVSAFLVVLCSFVTPALFPLFQARNLFMDLVVPLVGLEDMEGPVTLAAGQWIFTPQGDFDLAKAPPAPDYSQDEYWAFNPTRIHAPDAAQNVPPGVEPCLPNECEICAAFYLHPSTWYTNSGWNAPALHPVTAYLSDDAIGPQQANAFNSVCRIFAPRFRQMAVAGFLQPLGLKDPNSKQALDLAFSDVQRAFEYFMEHYHREGEPIIIAGHSQGSVLGEMLLRSMSSKAKKHLAAAYLIGWTFFDEDVPVRICAHARDVGCMVSFRTFGRGGNPKAFLYVDPSQPSVVGTRA